MMIVSGKSRLPGGVEAGVIAVVCCLLADSGSVDEAGDSAGGVTATVTAG